MQDVHHEGKTMSIFLLDVTNDIKSLSTIAGIALYL